MAKTNAEIQKQYREKQKDEESENRRLNTFLNLHAKLAIDKLALHYGITKKEALEKIILDHQTELTRSMSDEDFVKYHDSIR